MAPQGDARARPGRPSTGARERILAAALDVLGSDGYAGATTAKIAARSGQNKALIAYHFGSKDGLVAAVARDLSAAITAELLEGIGEPEDARSVAAGLVDGLRRIMQRDERLARVYFDLASQSVVEPQVRAIMTEMKQGYRRVLVAILEGVATSGSEAAAIYMIAALEGFALEQLESGESGVLARARELFVASVARL